jgi:hypothetical protein
MVEAGAELIVQEMSYQSGGTDCEKEARRDVFE